LRTRGSSLLQNLDLQVQSAWRTTSGREAAIYLHESRTFKRPADCRYRALCI